jgi:hypothetical protein
LAEDPIKTPFAISIIATDEILLITLRFRAGADRDAIESCMFQIADAFAAVERLSEKAVQDLFWEQKSVCRRLNIALPFGGASLTLSIPGNLMLLFDDLPANSVVRAFTRWAYPRDLLQQFAQALASDRSMISISVYQGICLFPLR